MTEEKYRQLLLELQKTNFIQWVIQNKIKNERGEELEFKKHLFMYDIYNDWSPRQAIVKSSQIGGSVMMVLKAFYSAGMKDFNVIYCVDEETELLSKRGWLKYNEVTTEDEILTFGKDELSKWSKVSEIFTKNVDMPLTSIETKSFSSLTTNNHRWFVKQVSGLNQSDFMVVETKDLTKHSYVIPKRLQHKGFSKKIYSNDFVELVAWCLTEGWYDHKYSEKHTTIKIAQSEKVNSEYVKRIRQVINNLGIKDQSGGNPKEYLLKRNSCRYFCIQGNIPRKIRKMFPDKQLTCDFVNKLTKEQLEILVETFIKADGFEGTNGRYQRGLIVKDKTTADAFSLAVVLLGYGVSIQKRTQKDKCYTVKLLISQDRYTKNFKPKTVQYKGVVWCPRTKDGNFLARRNGYVSWTGNTLPSFDFVRKFVPDKVGKVVEKNIETMGVWLKQGQKDTLDQKQVGDRTIYFDSAFEHESNIGTSSKGISLTSDLNIHDEANRSSLAIMNQYESRLDYSKYKGIWMFSNPTFPNVGVSEWYNRSDQKHWFITCDHCKHKQYLDWEKNVNYKLEQYVCQKCEKVFTDENRRVGEWVKKWQGKDISGYWINQMMAPWKSCKELIELENTKSKQYFYNFALGLPYAGSDVVVDRDLILKNITTRESSKDNVCIGVDVGLVKHVTVGTPYGIFRVFTTTDWDEIEREFLKYDATMVIDALPDLTVPRQLVDKYRGKVFINYYKEGTIAKSETQFKKDDKYGVVFTDRTRIIELAIDKLVKGDVHFHLLPEELNEFIAHWQSMYRYTDTDRQGNPVVRWESANDVDHYVHSFLYYLIAVEKAKSGEGAVFLDESNKIHGKPAYNPNAPDIAEFIGEPDTDWRYT